MKKKCLECNDEFIGRADKKFCSDNCRSAYNNKLNSDATNFVRNINICHWIMAGLPWMWSSRKTYFFKKIKTVRLQDIYLIFFQKK